MLPYFPVSALYVDEYCDNRHFHNTIHRIEFMKYFPCSHKVLFKIVCCDCEDEFNDKGSKVTLFTSEWKAYIESFKWEHYTGDKN